MKRIDPVKTLLVCLLIIQSLSMSAQTRVMTYNIRLDFSGDSLNDWQTRRTWIVELLQYYDPGILGIQEGLPHQVKYLDSLLTDRTWVGQGRDGGDMGEYSAIFYKPDQFELLMDSTIWLSGTPDKPSKGWDAALNRILTWAKFRSMETGIEFVVLNTHYDHVGANARLESSRLIVKLVETLQTEHHLPVILMGDFNATPESPPIRILSEVLQDSYQNGEKPPYGPVHTFNGFVPQIGIKRRIDYIFSDIPVIRTVVIDDRFKDRFPSDHFPVIAEVRF